MDNTIMSIKLFNEINSQIYEILIKSLFFFHSNTLNSKRMNPNVYFNRIRGEMRGLSKALLNWTITRK